MTRKNFAAIAASVARMNLDDERKGHVAYQLALSLRQFNPMFDRDRFYAACGIARELCVN